MPVGSWQCGEAIVDERMPGPAGRVMEDTVRAILKLDEGVGLNIEDAVLIGDRKFLAAQIQFHREIILASPAVEQNGRLRIPLAEGCALAQQAKRLVFLQQRRLDPECMRGM